MAMYCTVADLSAELDESKLIQLARDDSTPPSTTIGAADVQARLARYIADESNAMRSRLAGRVTDIDAPASGSQLEADLRRLAVEWVLERLYRRRGHFSENSNPYHGAKSRGIEELRSIASGGQKVGDAIEQDNSAWSTTEDDDPVSDSSFLRGF